MKIIYTSILGCIKTNNNKIIIEKFENSNGFIDALKENLKQTKKMMFVTNRWQSITPKDQPADEVFNDYHYTNQEYAQALYESYKLSGIEFDEMVIVDCDYKGNFEKDLLSSDMVFVQGGHTPRGLKILKNLNFENIVTKSDAVVLMTGTAAKLPASKVLSTHHGNEKEAEIEEGLNLCNYSIRPHFRITLKDRFDKKFRTRVKLIKDFSQHLDVYAIDKETYMIDNGNDVQIFGNCYLFRNGIMKKICKDNKSIKIIK